MTRRLPTARSRDQVFLRGVVSARPIVRGGGASRRALFPVTVQQGSRKLHHTVIVHGEGVAFAEHVLCDGMPVVVEGLLREHARSIVELYPGVRLPIVVIEAMDIRTAYSKRRLMANR